MAIRGDSHPLYICHKPPPLADAKQNNHLTSAIISESKKESAMSEEKADTTGTQEQQKSEKRDNPMEQLLYLALGGVMAARERMERDSAQFREFQHQAQDNARDLLDSLGSRGEKQKEEARTALRDLLREAIDDLGLATKEDLEQLKKDLER